MQFCEMLKFTTKFIKSAIIKKTSLNYLKCKNTTKQYYLLTKFFSVLECKKFRSYAKMCYFLMQVKLIIFIIRNRMFSNSVKI